MADDEDEDMDEAPIQLEAPSKVMTTETTVTVRARIACFDCQGRSDARSIQEILVKVAPQQLILLQGLPQVNIPCTLSVCAFTKAYTALVVSHIPSEDKLWHPEWV